jgi:hypothetical protein
MPCSFHLKYCTYEHGRGISHGEMYSWSESRQREVAEDRIKCYTTPN